MVGGALPAKLTAKRPNGNSQICRASPCRSSRLVDGGACWSPLGALLRTGRRATRSVPGGSLPVF